VSETALPAEAGPKKGTDILALAGRVENGDRTALAALREALQNPATVDLLGGDLAGRVQQKVIAKFRSKKDTPNPLLKESLTRKLELLRVELAGPNPTPLERLLIERVVTCWLQLHFLELVEAGQETLSVAQMTWWERCLDHAQKRYLSAIKTLAVVRKLALPVLARVNAGRRESLPPPASVNGHQRNGKPAAYAADA
jgi:hypothetical protein